MMDFDPSLFGDSASDDVESSVRSASADYPVLSDILVERPPLPHSTPVTIGRPAAGQTEAGLFGDIFDAFMDPPVNDEKVMYNSPSFDTCRFRRESRCWYPKSVDQESTARAGYPVFFVEDRGHCPRDSWAKQEACPMYEPGPHSKHPDAQIEVTHNWSDGGQRDGFAAPRRTSLMSTASAKTEFGVTAAWSDIQAKAKRIRSSGGVKIIASTDHTITAQVQGDENVYETTLMREPGSKRVALWSCGCAWSSYSWGRSGRWRRFEGRMCSHTLALTYEASSQEWGGGKITEGPGLTENPFFYEPPVPAGGWRKGSRTAAGSLTLYHGTSAAKAAEIQRSGLVPPSGVNPWVWYMLTTSREQAARYAGGQLGGSDPVVVEFSVPRDQEERGRVNSYLGIGVTHNVYGFEATAYGVGKPPLPAEYIVSVTPASQVTASLVGDFLDIFSRPRAYELESSDYANTMVMVDGRQVGKIKRSIDGSWTGLVWDPVIKFHKNVFEGEPSRDRAAERIIEYRSMMNLAARTASAEEDFDGPLQEVMELAISGDFTHSGLIVKSSDSGRVLLTQRTPYFDDPEGVYGRWEFPGGGIDEGENALESAIREFNEETGLQLPDDWVVKGHYVNGPYMAIILAVPNEAWTTNAELLSHETMGIGWFDIDMIEESDLAREEIESTDWTMVREAIRKVAFEVPVMEMSIDVDGNVWFRGQQIDVYPKYHPTRGLTAALDVLERTPGTNELYVLNSKGGGRMLHLSNDGFRALCGTTVDAATRQIISATEGHSVATCSRCRASLGLRSSAGKTNLYHSAPMSARTTIEQFGIDWSKNPAWSPRDPRSQAPDANYFHTDLDNALDMRSDGLDQTHDLYEIDTSGLNLELHQDPYEDQAVYTFSTIPPGKIKRISMLNDEPEPALPQTDGATDDDDVPTPADAFAALADEVSSPEEVDQMIEEQADEDEDDGSGDDPLSAESIKRRAAALGGDGDAGDEEIHRAAAAHLQRVSAKVFSPMEQQELIDEGDGQVVASNLDRLDIAGTHYEVLEDRQQTSGDSDGLDDLFF